MKIAVVAALLLASLCSALSDKEQWSSFKAAFGKHYSSALEEEYRFKVFLENLRAAAALQADDSSAEYGATKFSDLTPEEFARTHMNLDARWVSKWVDSLPAFAGAKSQGGQDIDWVAKGLVTSVKDQGDCGSCWTFSVAGAAEGCYASKYGRLSPDLAPQQILDCCQEEGSDGCDGGWPHACLPWAMQHDLATEQSYRYRARLGLCHKPNATNVGLRAGTCTYYRVPQTEEDVRGALQHAAVSVCIDASVLMGYKGGVVSGKGCSGRAMNHAVLLVASVGSSATPYYLVKNSWGDDWGEKGYFRISQDVNCIGIQQEACLAY
eukprot:m51a1_g11162 hypothetical protein (323) ;mRNA; f:287086-288113